MIIYVAMAGTVALIFLCTAIDFEKLATILSGPDSSGSNNIIHFHGISAMIIWLHFHLPFQQRIVRQDDAKALYVYIDCVDDGFSGLDSVIW